MQDVGLHHKLCDAAAAYNDPKSDALVIAYFSSLVTQTIDATEDRRAFDKGFAHEWFCHFVATQQGRLVFALKGIVYDTTSPTERSDRISSMVHATANQAFEETIPRTA